MIRTHEEHLAHYGIKRRSGRYPWGSGGNVEEQRSRDFLADVAKLKSQGMSETDIAKGMGLTTTQLRAKKSMARAQKKQQDILTAQRHKDDGWSNAEIAKRMGLAGESSVRALLKPGEKDKADALHTTANMLADNVAKKKYVDVGKGVELQIGVTKTHLDTAVAMLQEAGYALHILKVPQVNLPGQFTPMKVLAKPGTTFGEVSKNRAQIQQIQDYSIDHGRSFFGFQKPIAVNPNRLRINYAETGGKELDGVIYVRPGVKDLHLGGNRYGQVRIQIGEGHYIKGMAIYKEDLPKGVDLVFNTNKSNTGRKVDAMKPLETDSPDLPFGSLVHQYHDPATGKVNSALNVVGVKEDSGVEGSWDTWSRTLSSQMLSKQDPSLAQKQLDLTYERRIKEYDEISSLTNPTVRKELLNKFADQTDAASVHLKAANLPRQATKVLLPVQSMKDNEVYAPGMRHGESVALVRYPHGGKFEIPVLTVNNNNRDAKKLIGTGVKVDAIGINHKVAHRLSGADFDGDAVLVIPNKSGLVKSDPPLKELEKFDPHVYAIKPGSGLPPVTNEHKQSQMGRISNLITDMTIKGASSDELARAVKHSMVVIDSEKHQLNWRQSEHDNNIVELRQKYQGKKAGGAVTIISRAGAEVRVPERIPRPASKGGPVDPRTGKRVYVPTGRKIPEIKKGVPTGKEKLAETKLEKLAATDNAHTLVSTNPARMEILYADHSNRLKALANDARKQALPLTGLPYSPSAKAAYSNEVASLNAKLNNAKRNAPLERQAQLLASTQVSAIRRSNPDIQKEELTKVKQQALNETRNRTGAGKEKIFITQSEWNAIQAGAISKTKLQDILTNADLDTVRHLALPKEKTLMTSSKRLRAQSMLDSGYTQAEVASALGVSLSTLKLSLSE